MAERLPDDVIEVVGLMKRGDTYSVAFMSRRNGRLSAFTTGQTVGVFHINAITDSAAVLTVGDVSFEIEIGDLVVPWQHPGTPDGDRLVLDLVTMVAVSGGADSRRDGWRVFLRASSTGDTCTVKAGEREFGYHAKMVTDAVAILRPVDPRDDGTESRQLTAPSDDPASDAIPDLVAMSERGRSRWLQGWRGRLSSLSPSDQEIARRRIREYWQQQLRGEWGQSVSALLTGEQQQRLRREIASFWQ